MALLTISGEPGSRWEDVAHGASQLLKFELVTESRLATWIAQEFGPHMGNDAIPDRAWKPAVVSILARMASSDHLVVAIPGAESLFGAMPMLLRAGVIAPLGRRVGNVMLDQRLERPAASESLAQLDEASRRERRARFGRARAIAESFDIILNAEHMDASQMAQVLAAMVDAQHLIEHGMLSGAAEA